MNHDERSAVFRGIVNGLPVSLLGWIVFIEVWRLVWAALPS